MTIIWEDMLWTILAFALLYWLLNKFAFGKLFDVMEKRRMLVQKQLDDAKETREQAVEYVENQKAALQEAKKEAYDIVELSKKTSSKQAEQILEEANNAVARLKSEAVRDIESEKNKAVEALRSEIGTISVQIASKLLEKEVQEDSTNEQLVNQYLKEVGGKS
ncbi:ATP synthase F0F1 subunit B [Paenibacillus crassostreae]|uniref:ATP synthase subunit b n=2 Tax=Paenibacillus crassostreae TaxID=1763538 RepID=A0A162KQK8_9BACL|nr:F0F1 ATP synthase subunit B [Paenibacillus crassostreae]AOZ93204.1 ATP synthase F0 subunit B [Paenibacillus crassostreae]OAB71705.1 ATP synthase F0F1 subunit B [Paenibacillus crassostreae]